LAWKKMLEIFQVIFPEIQLYVPFCAGLFLFSLFLMVLAARLSYHINKLHCKSHTRSAGHKEPKILKWFKNSIHLSIRVYFWSYLAILLNDHPNYHISANSFRGDYSFLKVENVEIFI
jgi:hypothetical protein